MILFCKLDFGIFMKILYSVYFYRVERLLAILLYFYTQDFSLQN